VRLHGEQWKTEEVFSVAAYRHRRWGSNVSGSSSWLGGAP
jgi:hypothetical protein